MCEVELDLVAELSPGVLYHVHLVDSYPSVFDEQMTRGGGQDIAYPLEFQRNRLSRRIQRIEIARILFDLGLPPTEFFSLDDRSTAHHRVPAPWRCSVQAT
jgi:hypothetical protein